MGIWGGDVATLTMPMGPPRNETESFVHKQWMDDPSQSIGLPVGLQLIGRRHNEEKVLAMLTVVEKALAE